jgi:hypothetical protein
VYAPASHPPERICLLTQIKSAASSIFIPEENIFAPRLRRKDILYKPLFFMLGGN